MPRKQLDDKTRLLISLGGVVVVGLVRWLDELKNRHEDIVVHSWVSSDQFGRGGNQNPYDLWYIEIHDNRLRSMRHPACISLGFTVDLNNDSIFWVNENTKYQGTFPQGGNCFVRSHRWYRLLRQKFPNVRSVRIPGRGEIYDYRSTSSTAKLLRQAKEMAASA